MAEIVDNGGADDGKKKKRPKKGSTRVDMTPMVDLGFLLLTFFVLTSTFSKPKVMSLVYPAKTPIDVPDDPAQLVNNAITFLVTKDRVFYYEGEFNPKNGPKTQLTESNFGPDGVRKLLADKNKYVIDEERKLQDKLQRKEIVDSIYKKKLIEVKKDKRSLKVLVKTDTKALCRNFIDLVDELYIANIGMIAPVDLMKDEQTLIDEKTK
ncbi:MAG: biopolymer transporter ExbD [Fluviicola sp.]|nr:biopolymer transporter ExbD [Fluviicola sp.]